MFWGKNYEKYTKIAENWKTAIYLSIMASICIESSGCLVNTSNDKYWSIKQPLCIKFGVLGIKHEILK